MATPTLDTLLQKELDGTLTSAERQRLDGMLRRSATARSERELYRQMTRQLESLPRHDAPVAVKAGAMRTAFPSGTDPHSQKPSAAHATTILPSPLRFRAGLLVGTALAAVVLVLYFSMRSSSPEADHAQGTVGTQNAQRETVNESAFKRLSVERRSAVFANAPIEMKLAFARRASENLKASLLYDALMDEKALAVENAPAELLTELLAATGSGSSIESIRSASAATKADITDRAPRKLKANLFLSLPDERMLPILKRATPEVRARLLMMATPQEQETLLKEIASPAVPSDE